MDRRFVSRERSVRVARNFVAGYDNGESKPFVGAPQLAKRWGKMSVPSTRALFDTSGAGGTGPDRRTTYIHADCLGTIPARVSDRGRRVSDRKTGDTRDRRERKGLFQSDFVPGKGGGTRLTHTLSGLGPSFLCPSKVKGLGSQSKEASRAPVLDDPNLRGLQDSSVRREVTSPANVFQTHWGPRSWSKDS